jgi:hypothetical protein
MRTVVAFELVAWCYASWASEARAGAAEVEIRTGGECQTSKAPVKGRGGAL